MYLDLKWHLNLTRENKSLPSGNKIKFPSDQIDKFFILHQITHCYSFIYHIIIDNNIKIAIWLYEDIILITSIASGNLICMTSVFWWISANSLFELIYKILLSKNGVMHLIFESVLWDSNINSNENVSKALINSS